MTTRKNTPVPCEEPDGPTLSQFNKHLAEIHLSLIDAIESDPDMPDAEAAQHMISMGRVEHLMRCSRYLN
jgi:hypothetical protein